MDHPELTKNRLTLAFTIAVFADACEFPITYFEDFGYEWLTLLAKFGDVMLNLAVGWVMTRILGFHWVFLPSFVVEVIPGADMFPSWVAAVAYVVWERKKQQQNQPLIPAPMRRALAVVAESALTSLSAPTKALLPQPPPATIEVAAQVSPSGDSAAEKRLRHLQELRNKDLISQTEYDAKRQQVLAEI